MDIIIHHEYSINPWIVYWLITWTAHWPWILGAWTAGPASQVELILTSDWEVDNPFPPNKYQPLPGIWMPTATFVPAIKSLIFQTKKMYFCENLKFKNKTLFYFFPIFSVFLIIKTISLVYTIIKSPTNNRITIHQGARMSLCGLWNKVLFWYYKTIPCKIERGQKNGQKAELN